MFIVAQSQLRTEPSYIKLYLPHFFTQQMGFLMQAAQQTKGQWTGQAQTKILLQMAGMSSALPHLVTVVSVSARGQKLYLHVSYFCRKLV